MKQWCCWQRSVIKSQIKFQWTSNSLENNPSSRSPPSSIVRRNRRCLSLLDPTFQPGDNVANGHLFPVHSLFREKEEEEEEDHSTHFVSLPDRQTVSQRFARLGSGDTTLRNLAFGVQDEGTLFAVVMNLAPSTGGGKGRQCRGNSRREREREYTLN